MANTFNVVSHPWSKLHVLRTTSSKVSEIHSFRGKHLLTSNCKKRGLWQYYLNWEKASLLGGKPQAWSWYTSPTQRRISRRWSNIAMKCHDIISIFELGWMDWWVYQTNPCLCWAHWNEWGKENIVSELSTELDSTEPILLVCYPVGAAGCGENGLFGWMGAFLGLPWIPVQLPFVTPAEGCVR